MLKPKMIEYVLIGLQNRKLISDIEFHGDDEYDYRYYFVYSGKQDYRFSLESQIGEDDKQRFAVGFYNYNKETDKCDACIGSRPIRKGRDRHFNRIILFSDILPNIRSLIKEFQLEHVFKE